MRIEIFNLNMVFSYILSFICPLSFMKNIKHFESYQHLCSGQVFFIHPLCLYFLLEYESLRVDFHGIKREYTYLIIFVVRQFTYKGGMICFFFVGNNVV